MSTQPAKDAGGIDDVDEQQYRAIEKFIFRESRLADESRYREWEALWDEDGAYWVPIGNGEYDRTRRVSLIDDNRARIASRIKQLDSGKRYANVPVAAMRRLVSNLEVTRIGHGEFEAGANFVLLEVVMSSLRQQRLWGGRVLYRIRQRDGQLRMFFKKISLVNAGESVPNLPAII